MGCRLLEREQDRRGMTDRIWEGGGAGGAGGIKDYDQVGWGGGGGRQLGCGGWWHHSREGHRDKGATSMDQMGKKGTWLSLGQLLSGRTGPRTSGTSLTASQELRSPFMLASVEEGLWGSPRLGNRVSGHVQDTQINSNFRETTSSFLVEAHPKCTPDLYA